MREGMAMTVMILGPRWLANFFFFFFFYGAFYVHILLISVLYCFNNMFHLQMKT